MWLRGKDRAPHPPRSPRGRRAARAGLVLALLGVAATGAAGCRERVEPDRQARIGAEAEWAWLVAAKSRLDAKRGQLAGLGGPASSAAPPAPAAGGAGPTPGPAAAAGASAGPTPSPSPREQLAREIDNLSQQLGRRLVAYINANPPVEGAPLSARQLAGIRMKSDEEIAVAHEFIVRAGDYRRACEIYEAALAADPANPRLREELASAQAARYVSAEKFSRVAPGMTPEQVRAALGPPNAHDVRAYPDKGVVGWFYPRDASGAASAVWFSKREGKLTVYLCDWAALAALAPPPPPPAPAAPAAPAGQSAGGAGGDPETEAAAKRRQAAATRLDLRPRLTEDN
jgi:hypothetical protein